MIDIKFLREHPEQVKQNNESRNVSVDIDRIIELDTRRRELQAQYDTLRNEQKQLSKSKPTDEQISELKEKKEILKTLERSAGEIETELHALMNKIPNINAKDTPNGKDETSNVLIKEVGEIPKFSYEPQRHEALGEKLNLFDTARGARVSGNRFWYVCNDGVLLEFALIQFAFDIVRSHGFQIMMTPHMVRESVLYGAGFLPAQEFEIYKVNPGEDDLYLIGTSEATLVAYHADEVIDVTKPQRYAAYTPCYRREAGAYGKDTTGILRGHQFNKVEMVSFTNASQSHDEHLFLLSIQEEIINALKLPYRVMNLASGDMSGHAAQCFDIEVWLPGQNKYRELTSCSNVTDYQARRMNIRHKTGDGLEFVHTLNGTATATGRTMIAILENYQQSEGSVVVPDVLRPYLKKDVIEV